jgi:hypothetical protein
VSNPNRAAVPRQTAVLNVGTRYRLRRHPPRVMLNDLICDVKGHSVAPASTEQANTSSFWLPEVQPGWLSPEGDFGRAPWARSRLR